MWFEMALKECPTLDVCVEMSVETLVLFFFFNTLGIFLALTQYLESGYTCFTTKPLLCSCNVINKTVGASHKLSLSV